MTTYLPTDANNNPIPALRLKATGGAHIIAATASSARNSTAFDSATQIVSLYATVPVYVRFGSSSVEAANTDHYFPDSTYYDFAIGGEDTKQFTHVAVLRAGSEDGSVYISEKE
ncbi:MAG: hypothetical protein GC136_02385 [Alphaproteobacteria bacterium]|nr:hypothetical protein [Alphaproteobacteria bacterium]